MQYSITLIVGKLQNAQVTNKYLLSAEWMVEEGQVISSNGPVRVAVITGPAASLLKAERLALNVLARCTSIATYAHHLSELTSSRLAGTRKTTPGFRLVEKYALAIAGVDPHRQSCTDCIMIKDNHIDLFDGDISDIVKAVKSLASFTTKIEVECRSLVDAENAVESGADIVMFDNFIPSLTDLASLRSFNPRVLIELSGGITPLNIHNYPSDPAIVLSLGSLTHSLPPLLDFSFKISK